MAWSLPQACPIGLLSIEDAVSSVWHRGTFGNRVSRSPYPQRMRRSTIQLEQPKRHDGLSPATKVLFMNYVPQQCDSAEAMGHSSWPEDRCGAVGQALWLLVVMFRASQHQTVSSMAAVAHGRHVSHRTGACTEGVSRRNIQPDMAIRCGRPPRRTKIGPSWRNGCAIYSSG
jgi:hypothetical protein